jgi:phosphotransferase system enzyme I (PtsI)
MIHTGTMIAPGIASGRALVWVPAIEPVPRRTIARSAVAEEQRRFEHARQRAKRELEEIALRVAVSAGKSAAAIFTAHQSILEDRALLGAIQRGIEEHLLNAEAAVAGAVEKLAAGLASLPDPYLAARADDLDDLGQRLLTHLRNEGVRQGPRFVEPRILVSENLAAADVVSLDRERLLGIVMTNGGATSHAALLASTIGVPVVGGIPRLLEHVRDGDVIVVDGNHGQVVSSPTPLAIRQYHTRQELFRRFCGELAVLREVPAVTPDGRRVDLTANVGLAEEIPRALAQGASGVGLLRTEYFYLAHREPPTEEAQYNFYRSVLEAIAPHSVTFRTFDLGGDKLGLSSSVPETNPMLGCRGIRTFLERPELLLGQLRALLRASRHGPVKVMFPLITSLTEFQDTMRVVAQAKEELRGAGVPFDESIPFGCMIETPAAATIPDILASEVDFFSIGSNDLIQYTLAADRTNPRVGYLYEPLHLAVLRMMRAIIRAAQRRGRRVSLCGEMAADPIYTIILLGLGVDELSMNPVMIPAVKRIIRSVAWSEAREVARGVLRERRAKDVQAYLEKMMSERFPQVMSIYGHENLKG